MRRGLRVLAVALVAGVLAAAPVAAQESATAVRPVDGSVASEAEGGCAMTTNIWPPYTYGGATRYAEIQSFNSCTWAGTHRVSIQRDAGSTREPLNPKQATVAPGIWLTLISDTTKCIGEYDRYRTYASHYLPGGDGTKVYTSTIKIFDC